LVAIPAPHTDGDNLLAGFACFDESNLADAQVKPGCKVNANFPEVCTG
jgi:hypothetical protein